MNWKLAIPASLLVLALVPATPAIALDWGLGTDLGANIFRPDYPDAEGVLTFTWPAVGPSAYQIGGLRVSFMASKPKHEIWVGTSLLSLNRGGHPIHQTMVTGNYQYNFPTQGRVSPYLTAGLGLDNYGDRNAGASGTIFGFGAGLSKSVTNGAGRLRVEVRYDQQTEGKSHDHVFIPKGGSFGLKLGFDLWVK